MSNGQEHINRPPHFHDYGGVIAPQEMRACPALPVLRLLDCAQDAALPDSSPFLLSAVQVTRLFS